MSKDSADDTSPSWARVLPEGVRRRLENSPILQKIVGNTSWLMFERVVNMTVRFFVGVWLVRYLGPESYGLYSYALSLVGLFMAFATLGLDNVIIRNLTRDRYEEGEIMGTAFVLRLCAGLISVAVIAIIVLQSYDEALRKFVVIVISAKLIFSAVDVFDFWFQSKIESKYVVWIRSAITLLYSGGQAICILAGLSVKAFAILVAAQMALQVIGTSTMYFLRRDGHSPWRVRVGAATEMMRDAWPLIMASLSVAVYMKIDQVMIGRMIDDTAVGIYATAAKISELWYFIPSAIAGSVYPKIVSLRESGSTDHYEERMQDIYDVMACIAYVIIIPVVLTAKPMIELLFGAEFSESAAILQIHIWAFIFVALGVVRGRWLVAENYTRFAMVAAILGALANVGLNLLLLPDYGGIGAAWATLIAQVVSTLLACALWKPVRIVALQMMKALVVPFRLRRVINRITE